MKNSHRELSNLRAAIATDVQAAMDHSQNTGVISLPLVDNTSWLRAKNILRNSDSNTGGTPENRQSSAQAFRQSWNHRS